MLRGCLLVTSRVKTMSGPLLVVDDSPPRSRSSPALRPLSGLVDADLTMTWGGASIECRDKCPVGQLGAQDPGGGCCEEEAVALPADVND